FEKKATPTKEVIPTTKSATIKTLPSRRKFLKYAASVFVIVAAGLAYFFTKSPNYDQLFAQSFAVDRTSIKNLLDKVGQSSIGKDNDRIDLGRGLNAFLKDDLAESTDILQTYVGQHPDDLDAQYYLGLFQLARGQILNAQQTLLPISSSKNKYQDAARWYLGLAYLKNPETVDNARVIFELLAKTDDSLYQVRAQEIVNQL
ncbi:MAG: hypothetical protein AAGJ18_26835, partial [Bacteroidota bacterium]